MEELYFAFTLIGFIWLLVGSVFDIKTREVPNWLSFSLIAVGFGGRAIASVIEGSWSYLMFGVIGFVSFAVFGSLMYYTKQWGGGDAKLLMGLGVMFGDYGSSKLFLIDLLINVMVAGAVIGILWSIVLCFKDFSKFKSEIGKFHFNFVYWIVSVVFILNLFGYFLFPKELFYFIVLLGFGVLLFVFVLVYMKIIDKAFMIRKINVSELTEGDWLVKDGKISEVSLKEILSLKKMKVKMVFVRYGIPFVPSFFIGFLMSLSYGWWWVRFF